MPKIVIASRKSDLARIQAQSVAHSLKKLDPALEIELTYRESLGDKNQEDPLWKMPEKGVFTQDFREDLLAERIDIVVHSWKDLPTDMPPDTQILGAPPRADQRDLLLIKKSTLARGGQSTLRVLSSSPRRAYNLTPILKDLLPASLGVERVDFADIRGNVPTRVRKCLAEDTADGLVLAKAGIDRLLSATAEEYQSMRRELTEMLSDFRWMVLPLSLNPSAAAQGALALEIKSTRRDLAAILAPLICARTTAQVQVERKILSSYGGGCHQKIGVSIIDHDLGPLISLKGKTDDGRTLDTFGIAGDYLRTERSEIHAPDFDLGPKKSGHLAWAAAAYFDAAQSAAVEADAWFPKTRADVVKIFDRRELAVDLERLRHQPLMVARANALPSNYVPGADQIIWTAGNETWRSLAERNYWVSGSCDALGECFEPDDSASSSKSIFASIDALAPGQVGLFMKVTHDGSAHTASSVHTYTLVPKPDAILPSAKPKWFFWMSGSAFLWAVQKTPEILGALHSCGPGNTLKTLLAHFARVECPRLPKL